MQEQAYGETSYWKAQDAATTCYNTHHCKSTSAKIANQACGGCRSGKASPFGEIFEGICL